MYLYLFMEQDIPSVHSVPDSCIGSGEIFFLPSFIKICLGGKDEESNNK